MAWVAGLGEAAPRAAEALVVVLVLRGLLRAPQLAPPHGRALHLPEVVGEVREPPGDALQPLADVREPVRLVRRAPRVLAQNLEKRRERL